MPPRSHRHPLLAVSANAPRVEKRSALLWVCLGTGPSLTPDDVEACRGHSVIAVNNTYQLAPWAEALYACDAQWWGWHGGAPSFAGLKYAMEPRQHATGGASHAKFKGVTVLRNTGDDGLEFEPYGLRTGKNSGYQAINLAVHFGAKRIVLLGYDMGAQGGKDHYFGAHPSGQKPPYHIFLKKFETIVEPLKQAGVEVINCSRATALKCFPRRPLADVLAQAVAA